MSVTPPERSFSRGAPAGDASPTAEPARIFRNRSVRRAALAVIQPFLNPLVLALARGKMLHSAVIQHRGRRSGRAFATPVQARPTADGFVVPLTFGGQADWFRNVRAAGGCVIEWNGAQYPVVEPEIVDRAAARAAFTAPERALLALFGMESFVRLRHAPAGAHDPLADRCQSSATSHGPGGESSAGGRADRIVAGETSARARRKPARR